MNPISVSLVAVPVSWVALLAMGYQINAMIGIAFVLGAAFREWAG